MSAESFAAFLFVIFFHFPIGILKSDLQRLNFILNFFFLHKNMCISFHFPVCRKNNNYFTFEFRQAFRYFSSQFLPSLQT